MKAIEFKADKNGKERLLIGGMPLWAIITGQLIAGLIFAFIG